MGVEYDNAAVGDCVSMPTADSGISPAETNTPPQSAAVERFRSCRWRKPPENGEGECCTHRDVLPLTGTKGFDPEAWCVDCQFFKLRRTPRKNH